MNIGIIGVGIVGEACKYGFEKLGHTVICHDIKLDTSIEDVLFCDVIYICVPTPTLDDGSCDVSIVEQTVVKLGRLGFDGVVAIKSTVKPTTSDRLATETGLKICFVPEFLRERCAVTDFTENHDLLAVGTDSDYVYNIVKECHGNLPQNHAKLSRTEAEMLKYYSNVINALKIVFANSMYEVCNSINCDYTKIKDTFIKRGTTKDLYLDVNKNFRGYAGVCLPKDTKALDCFAKELGLDLKLFETIEQENNKFKKTVFKGMRK